MSRKTIPFRMPQSATRVAADISSTGAAADQWVGQSERLAEDAVAEPVAAGEGKRAFTITVSAEPYWFDAWKVAVYLPYAVACYWALGAARSLRTRS
jgi:hypothetical protein